MTTYTITTRNGQRFTVEAKSYHLAAEKARVELLRRKDGTIPRGIAQQVSGNHGQSGWFQAYKRLDGQNYTSVGEQFHVS